jgi:MerR family transcriptional regulator, mercuric resistance operon regulatory protein
MSMTIGSLARSAGVGVETVRYYQRRGLLAEPERPSGGAAGSVRRYDVDDLRRLRFIRSAQEGGFTLEEISELLELDATNDRARARAIAQSRITKLDRRIAALEMARSRLQKLANACGSNLAGPCPILESFDPEE